MAIYSMSVQKHQRSKGHSAVAAAAYRAGEKHLDERTGEVKDFERKRGVEDTQIILPKDAPAWALDRSRLWNAAEAAEGRINSVVARDIRIALPHEINQVRRRELAHEYARHIAERYGVAVDVSIHAPDTEKGGDDRNHHAHLLISTRRLGREGFTEKTRELDDKISGPQEIEHLRAEWELYANRSLAHAGAESRIDHRTLKAQGIDRLPTKHLGPAATAMERRGVRSDRGRWNRRVAALHNARNRANSQIDEYRRADPWREDRAFARALVEPSYERVSEAHEAGIRNALNRPGSPVHHLREYGRDNPVVGGLCDQWAREISAHQREARKLTASHQAHDQAQQIHAEIHAPKQPVQATEPRRQDNAGGLGAAPPVQGAERPEAAVQRGAALPNHQPDLKAQEKQPEQRPAPKQPKKPEPPQTLKPEIIQMLDSKTPEQVQEQFEQRQREAAKQQSLARFLEKRPEWQEWHQGREEYAAEKRLFGQDRQANKMVRDAFKVQETALAQDYKSFDERFEKAGALERTRYAIGTGALAKEEKELAARKLALAQDKAKNFEPQQLAHKQRVKEMTALAQKVAAERKRAGLGGKSKANFEKEYTEFKAKAVKTWAKEVSAWDTYKTERAKAQEPKAKPPQAQERPTPAKVQEQPTKAQEQPTKAKATATPGEAQQLAESKMLAEKARLLAVAEAARKAGPAQFKERMEAEQQAKKIEAAYVRTLSPMEQFKYKQRQEKRRGLAKG